MGKIFFTSDWHFNHNKDFIYKARGFSSIEEMNEAIVTRHNSVVKKEDTVYVLGDLCMGADNESNKELLKKLNGELILLTGNHDTNNRIKMYLEVGIQLRGYACILQLGIPNMYKKRSFYLSHYPTLTGNHDEPYAPWCLYGHTHSTDRFDMFEKRCYNVGMDAHDCYPVSLEEIFEDIKNERMKTCQKKN